MASNTNYHDRSPSSDSPTPALSPGTDLYIHSWKLAIVIGSLCLGIFLYGLDINIIGVAIPSITTEFGSLDTVAWYGSAYLLTVTAFQPGFGTLYKYFNAKFVYIGSLLTFEVGSIICASARSSNVLIFARAFLGVGAAGLLQGALAIISYAVSLEKVPQYQGIVISALGISVCLGPVIGGALTEYASWRWCFWINVPAGVVVMAVVLIFVPRAQSLNVKDKKLPLGEKLRRMDAPGTTLFLGAVCCLLLALTWGGQAFAWNDSKIIGLFIGSGLLAICFCYWLWRQGDFALIPLRVLRKRSIAMGAVILWCFGLVMNVYGYYLPLFFQSAQGTSATLSGVRFIALIIPQIVALALTGAVVSKWGHYVPYIIAGLVIAAVGGGLLTTINVATATVKWAAYLTVTGIGIGMASQLPYTAVQVVLDPTDVATGNAIAVFSTHLGAAIGLAIGQNLLIQGLVDMVPKYTSAVSAAQVLAAGASGLVALAGGQADILEALRWAYSEALRRVLILCVAATCLAFPAACSMEWLNIRTEADKRKGDEGSQELQQGRETATERKYVQSEGKSTDVQTSDTQV